MNLEHGAHQGECIEHPLVFLEAPDEQEACRLVFRHLSVRNIDAGRHHLDVG